LTSRDLENLRGQRRIKISVRVRLDARIPGLVDERRQPPDLQFSSDDDEQIGGMQFQDEARLRFHEMGILVALRERFDRNLVTPDLSRQRLEVLRRGDDVDCRKGIRAAQESGCERHDEYPFLHRPSLSLYQEIKSAVSERVRTVSADREQELEECFVRRDTLRIVRSPILAANL